MARPRSGAVSISAIVRARQGGGQGEKVSTLEAAEADIVFKDGKFTVAGTDVGGLGRRRVQRLYCAQVRAGARAAQGGAFYPPISPSRPAAMRNRDRSGDRRARSLPDRVDDFGGSSSDGRRGQVHGGIAQGVARRCSSARSATGRPARDGRHGSCRAPTSPRCSPSIRTAPNAHRSRSASKAAARRARSRRRRPSSTRSRTRSERRIWQCRPPRKRCDRRCRGSTTAARQPSSGPVQEN